MVFGIGPLNSQKNLFIAGYDPGTKYVGYSLVIFPERQIVCLGTVVTEKSNRKGSVRHAADINRRARNVWKEIWNAWRDLPNVICSETMPNLQNSTVRADLNYVAGSLVLYSEILDIPLLEATPMEIKQAACGKASASKEEVIAKMEALYPGVEWPVTKARGENSVEMASHAADSLAAIEACLRDPAVLAIKQLLCV